MSGIYSSARTLAVCFFFLCCFLSAESAVNPLLTSKDSLLRLYQSSVDNQRKIELLTHLSDIDLLQDKYDYTLKLWELAVQCGDQEAMSISVRPLALRYLDVCRLDSADIWINNCERYLKGKRKESVLQYLLMMRDIRDFSQRKELAQKLLVDTTTLHGKENRYKYMRRLYCLGAIALMTQNNNRTYAMKPWDSYLKEGLKIAESIPLEEDYLFRTQFLTGLGRSGSEYTRKLMDVYKEYRNLPHVKNRIFSSHRTEITAIARMLTHGEEIGREQMDYYFGEFKRLLKLYPQDVAPPLDFYYYYVAQDYYDYIGDYHNAILCCDSVIKSAPKYGMSYDYQYEMKSDYLAKLGRWEEAYKTKNRYIEIKNSIGADNLAEQITELQVQYDVNKLELEKANLIARQRGISLLLIGLVVLLLAGWSFYIYRMLRVTRRLKQGLEVQTEKALESEKMKTLFMRSMSHEIRTPLNSVQGFSGLLLADAVDEESKPEMKEAIEKGVAQLTGLLDDMLEISLLGCTNDVLPTALVEVGAVCADCLDQEKQKYGKPTVEYKLDNQCGTKLYNTNLPYLTKVISNLLANANKFTPEGSVTLACREDVANKKLVISVTDTGIGIPVDKREWVFEAFTKVDDFKPGTGLGLYVCKEIVAHLCGSIYLDSSYTAGTRMVVELPNNVQIT